MAKRVRNLTETLAPAVVTELNALRRAVAAAASAVHADVTCVGDAAGTQLTIAVANASDLATSIALANEIKRVLNLHYNDSTRAHKAADTAVATADATDLATVQTLLNALKTSYETHRASTTYHYTADGTNTIAAANASDQGTANTLANELKTDINAHGLAALAGSSLEVVNP